MMDNTLRLLGVARKAGRLEIGEEPVGAAARARQAHLILLACDAAENSARRGAHFAQAGNVLVLCSPFTKGELGGAVGRTACAMLAVTDPGLASAVAGRLAQADPEQYAAAAAQLGQQAEKALQRQREQRAHEKKQRKRKPWAPPPAQPATPPRRAQGTGMGNGGCRRAAVVSGLRGKSGKRSGERRKHEG